MMMMARTTTKSRPPSTVMPSGGFHSGVLNLGRLGFVLIVVLTVAPPSTNVLVHGKRIPTAVDDITTTSQKGTTTTTTVTASEPSSANDDKGGSAAAAGGGGGGGGAAAVRTSSSDGDTTITTARREQSFSTTSSHHIRGEPAQMTAMGMEEDSSSSSQTKCERAGYYPHMFEQDSYELRDRGSQGFYDGTYRKPPKRLPCKSATANARGEYTSRYVPCTMTFHHVDPSKSKSNKLKANSMADVCSDENMLSDYEPLEHYLVKWPDECVGDYPRCYTLPRDDKYLLRFLCKHTEIELSQEVTHVQVDCTQDRKELTNQEEQAASSSSSFDPFWDQLTKWWRELYVVIFVALAICLLSGVIFLCCTYRYAIAPYLATLKAASSKGLKASLKRSKSDPEMRKLMAQQHNIKNATGDDGDSERTATSISSSRQGTAEPRKPTKPVAT